MPDHSADSTRQLVLLGRWDLVVDGESVGLGGREQRLSALLAVTGRRARAQVAGILWPESTDERALASLRRAVLQTQRRSPGLLHADRTTIGLHPDVAVDVDGLRAVTALVDEAEPHRELLAALVGGELLPGWYDEWVEPERERIQQDRVRALEQLARRALDAGDPALALDAARAAAGIEPLLEAASELAIRGHLGRGDRASAAQELERYRDLVHAELDESPSPALVALLDPPRDAAPPPTASLTPVVPRPRRDVAPPTDAPAAAPRDDAGERLVPVLRDAPVQVEPRRLTTRGAAARLVVAAGVVLAASLGVAGLGVGDGGEPSGRDAGNGRILDPPARVLPDAAAGSEEPTGSARHVLVRPVAADDGAAAFLVRADHRPARVRLEVAVPGLDVVRRVVVRRADGQRLVVDGLDPGTYRWSATSSSAASVTGQVRVVAAPTVVAVAESASPEPSPVAAALTESPAPSPSPSPSPTPTPTPTPSPTPTPAPTASPTARPTSEPTDPGTTDPGPVG